ncbi:MAG TPA: YceI family protein [Rhodanobacteraceae bacterium]|nr:YceI family protein [Rhodanobacteraceae bacterium]
MHPFRRTLFVLAVTSLVACAAQAKEHTYTLDPGHTDVVATWTHMGFSQPSAMFTGIEGTLQFDPEHPEQAKLSVTVPIASVHTASDALNEHLQNADFFDAAKYPVATFKSTKVERGVATDQLKVTGDLTLHGVTRPLTLNVTVGKVGPHPMSKALAAGFSATAKLNRSEWGVKTYVPMISDQIRLQITTEAAVEQAKAK